MTDSAEEFDALLARARQGDEAALAQLARQYEPQVRLVARLRLGPALRPYLDSADLVQSVHRSLLVGLRDDRFDISTPQQLVALALTMVRRKAARHWQRLQRQQRLSDAPTDANLPQLLLNLSAPEPDPARAAQLHDAVTEVCRHLDADERRLLDLHLQGYRTADVARLLGLNADVLRVRISRLRQRLRACGVLSEWL